MTAADNFEALLQQAREADPSERIELRDPIAAHGLAAIPTMRTWLVDPDLGRFAGRVLGKIAEQPEYRSAVLMTFADADFDRMPPHVAEDVSEVIARIPGTTRSHVRGRPSRSGPAELWPGHREVSQLQLRFHEDMLDIFRLAGEATRRVRSDGSVARGYWASYFLRGVRNHGGPSYARQLLKAEGTSDGFQRLTDEGRLDLTVEALVLRPEYAQLFNEDERAIAASRLARAGYSPPRNQ